MADEELGLVAPDAVGGSDQRGERHPPVFANVHLPTYLYIVIAFGRKQLGVYNSVNNDTVNYADAIDADITLNNETGDNAEEEFEKEEDKLSQSPLYKGKEFARDMWQRSRVKAEVIKEEIKEVCNHAQCKAKEVCQKATEKAKIWKVIAFESLPEWLADNDFLHSHHRPPMPSFKSCFLSIFKVHSETVNIWTHLLGFFSMITVATYFLASTYTSLQWQEVVVYLAFFIGAIVCLGFSWLFHTVSCHSVRVARLFSKLDYTGIAILIVGSFIPWIYFGFYCFPVTKTVYISLISVLGTGAVVVAMWDKFAKPKFRPLRAGMFVALGLCGIVPGIHYIAYDGFSMAISAGSLGWVALSGALYIFGAMLYVVRVPERFFPGKCDIVFQSHQIFHVLVVAAAYTHYHALCSMQNYRNTVLGTTCSP